MTIKALFPSSEPALELDFANTKALDPRVSFTRASTGTCVGADGLIKTAASGVARFDHNPATGESLGLLVEGAVTNLFMNSNNFLEPGPNADHRWSKSDTSVTANAAIAPDGTLTASKIIATATTASHFISRPRVAASPSMASIHLKAAEYTVCDVYDINLNASFRINLLTGALSSAGLGNFFPSWYGVDTLTNGWYRVRIGRPETDATINNPLRIYPNGSQSYTGDGTSGILVWGAQLEIGQLVTSYIPTPSATATRAADVATVSNTNSRIFPTSAFTTVNSPFGTAGGGSTVRLVGPTIKRTAIYAGDLPQVQINALTNTGDFWRWRVLGSTFALPSFTTNGSVTVDWGDGTVQTLTTGVYTFTNGGGYHDIGFRLDSGTFFKPNININATYKDRVIAVGPAPASMKLAGAGAFAGCNSLRSFDATVDATGGTDLSNAWTDCRFSSFPLINTSGVTNFTLAWYFCFPLTSFPLINTAAGTNFNGTWRDCSGLASFPLINTVAGTIFSETWSGCSSLTSFPLINTGAGTNFSLTWFGCSSLTSFPLINVNAGTNFGQTWRGCANLTSFPTITFNSATNLNAAWYECTNLATFPANAFNTTGTLVSTAFTNAFINCALTATSIENILTSLVTNGQSNITLTLSGGTNANTSTWSTAANNAYITLVSRGWAITQNGTAPT